MAPNLPALYNILMYTFIFWFSIFAFFVFAGPAHAYIDPGSGSIIWQVILAGLFSTMYFTKLYWHKIKKMLLRKHTDENTHTPKGN